MPEVTLPRIVLAPLKDAGMPVIAHMGVKTVCMIVVVVAVTLVATIVVKMVNPLRAHPDVEVNSHTNLLSSLCQNIRMSRVMRWMCIPPVLTFKKNTVKYHKCSRNTQSTLILLQRTGNLPYPYACRSNVFSIPGDYP